jgi:hypothetical protein
MACAARNNRGEQRQRGIIWNPDDDGDKLAMSYRHGSSFSTLLCVRKSCAEVPRACRLRFLHRWGTDLDRASNHVCFPCDGHVWRGGGGITPVHFVFGFILQLCSYIFLSSIVIKFRVYILCYKALGQGFKKLTIVKC